MTQTEEQRVKLAEFKNMFLMLDETRQEHALYMLRALDFAQSKMPDWEEPDRQTS